MNFKKIIISSLFMFTLIKSMEERNQPQPIIQISSKRLCMLKKSINYTKKGLLCLCAGAQIISADQSYRLLTSKLTSEENYYGLVNTLIWQGVGITSLVGACLLYKLEKSIKTEMKKPSSQYEYEIERK